MRLTRESEYALLGLAFVAGRPTGDVVSLAEIAAARRLPPSFLAKSFQKLARHGLVVSHRGPGRGYALARRPDRIALREVLEAIEGVGLFTRCMFWDTHCSDSAPCPLHRHMKHRKPDVAAALERLTLRDLVHGPVRHVWVRRRTARGTATGRPSS